MAPGIEFVFGEWLREITRDGELALEEIPAPPAISLSAKLKHYLRRPFRYPVAARNDGSSRERT